jgi:glycosyltransferase involved in cell wall biosynthesis
MTGRNARLSFRTTAAPGSIATVLLHCTAVTRAGGTLLRATAACGATTTMAVPQCGPPDADRGAGSLEELVLGLDCTVGDDRSIDVTLEIAGSPGEGFSDAARPPSIGVQRVAYVPADSALLRWAPCQRIRPIALTGPSGGRASPVGLRSMLHVLRVSRLLQAGWASAQAWGAWMAGGAARLVLSTAAAPGETVRVVMQLRSAPATGAIDLAIVAGCGASSVWRLPGGRSGDLVWLDCDAGADGRVALEIADESPRAEAAGGRIGLVSIAYGRRSSIADRLGLTETMLYPEPEGPGAIGNALASDLRFAVVGHFAGTYSLAAINRSLALALETACPGTVRIAQVETDPVHDLSGIPSRHSDPLAELSGRGPDNTAAEIAIVQHWPVLPPPHCDLPIALFAWEESLVPRAIVQHFNRHYRGLIAQTNAVAKALRDSGVRIPVSMVGCALDLSAFSEVAERRAARPRPPVDSAHPFVFLHVSSCFPRKGVDMLLAAYGAAFRRDDPVRLVIKGFPNPHNDVAERIERLCAADPEAPAIEFVNRDLAEADLLQLYEAADAMVLPTRGEGFNMPAVEAMAAGVPLIVTGHGGHADFVGPECARLIDYQFAAAQSHVSPPGSTWVEPDTADLVAALRECLAMAGSADGDRAAPWAGQIERARQAVAPLGRSAAWGRRVASAAQRLLTAEPPRSVSVGWVSTWKVRCGIAEYSRLMLEHFDDAERDVTVFCEDRTEPDTLRVEGEPQAQIAWRIGEPGIEALAAAIESARVDAVIVQYHPGLLGYDDLAALLRDPRVSARPVLVFGHNSRHLHEISEASRADAIAALRLAAAVLVHSLSDLNILKAYGLVDNVALFPHGAERTELAPPPIRNFASGSAPLVGAYGFFLPHKGFDLLLRALPVLLARWSGLRLRLVTAEYPRPLSADELARCRELAGALGVAEAIEWITDYLPNQRSLELLNACDLIVLPYQHTTESASGAARIATASRAPVAVTPIPIFADLGEAVLRLGGGEVGDIESGIAAILDDEAGRRLLIERAGLWLEDHDWRLLAARLHGMLAGLAASRMTGL